MAEKSFSQAIDERRATRHYRPTAVQEDDLRRILEAALAAPSGYDLQPWRFVVVRDAEQRKRLRQAAMNQPKVEEAPVVIVACGDTAGWRTGDLDEMLRIGSEHGYGGPAEQEKARQAVTGFLGGTPGNAGGIRPDLGVWVNRHTMIALTTIMWM